MKSFVIALIIVLNLTFIGVVLATGPEYYSSKSWILEKTHISDKESLKGMICLGNIDSQSGFVVPYNETLSIQDLIAMTSYKKSTARVTVLRKEHPADPVFDGIVKPSDNINFILRPGDVVWVGNPLAPT